MRPMTATVETSAPMVSKEWADRSRELGMFLSALLVDVADWRWLFVLPVALVIVALGMTLKSVPPPPATPVHTPIALPRCSPGKVEVMTARVIGMIIAAPIPPATRAAIMISAVGARPATTFATPKMPSPAISMGLRPRRSPIAPSGSSSAARARV